MQTPFLAWTGEMSVGVAVLDADHKKLIDIINELHDGIAAGHKKEILVAVLDRLAEYTGSHFAREEEFFAQAHYPAAAMHKSEHDSLINKVANLRERFKNASVAMLDLELMSFLRNWLVTHIQGADKKYTPYLKAHGIA